MRLLVCLKKKKGYEGGWEGIGVNCGGVRRRDRERDIEKGWNKKEMKEEIREGGKGIVKGRIWK